MPHDCTNDTLIHSPPESFKSQTACSIECRVHTCHSPLPATDCEIQHLLQWLPFRIFLNKRILNNALWSDEWVYQLAKEIQLSQPEEFNNIFFETVVSIWKKS